MARSDVRTAVVLGAAYFANFGALATSAPFLALILRDAGVSDAATAEWLALFLLARWVAVPLWTLLADRLRSIPRVLQLVTLGALASFAPLVVPLPAAIVLTCLAAFSLFRAPFGPLLDSLTLVQQEAGGAAFGRVRAWGTAGYTLGAVATGALVARHGGRGVVFATVASLAFAAVASFAASTPRAPIASIAPTAPTAASTTSPTSTSFFAFVRRPRIAMLFVIAVLHQIGLAPYDALFPAYFAPIAGATLAGVAVAVGASCEFVFMLGFASLPKRWGAARVIRLACVGSAIRWTIVGFTRAPLALVAAQSLHALTFGAFYLACVAIVDEESPPSARTTSQGIVSAWTYGVAAAIALSIAGLIEREYGLAVVFRAGAIASTVAALIPLKNPTN